MDIQILETLKVFFSDIRDKSTDEVYSEYVDQCKLAGVNPRTKQIVIREICAETGCEVKEVRKKYFVAEGV